MKEIKDQQTESPPTPSRIGVFVQITVPTETSLQSNPTSRIRPFEKGKSLIFGGQPPKGLHYTGWAL